MAYSPGPVRAPYSVPHRALSGNAICIAAMITWAIGFPAAEILLQRWDPLPLITARLLMAVAVLVPIWAMLEGPATLLRTHWGKGVIVGGVGFGLGTYFLLVAQDLTDPVTVAVVAAAMPIAATLIEAVGERRWPSLRFGFGLMASVCGGIIAVGQVAAPSIGLGAAFAVMSCFCFAWGSHAAVRELPDLTPIGRTTVTLAGAFMFNSVLLLGAMVMGWSVIPDNALNAQTLVPLAVYALGAMALSQFLWIAAVGRLGVALASFHINVAPFYVMLVLMALGAGWNWDQALGAAVVASGVVIAQRR